LALTSWLVAALCIGAPPGPWQPSRAGDGAEVLRVLVVNLHAPSSIPDLDELDGWLAASGADVALLNEARGYVHERLAAAGTRFPYSAYCAGQLHCETLVLSRRPLHDVAYHVSGRYGGKVLFAGIDVGGARLNLGLTHVMRPIPHGSPYRNFQQSRYIAGMAQTRERVVLVGDFNAVPWGRVMRMFRETAGLRGPTLWQGTWPKWLPVPFRLHIDHVLVGCGVELRAIETLRFPRSDHLGVLASLAPAADASCPAATGPARPHGASGR
jgi:endonuclease/exonuclease/phosphatase (EEP) superfamily protein YafD